MNNSLFAEVVSNLTMLAQKVDKDYDSKTQEVENMFFFLDKEEEEYIRLNFQWCFTRKKHTVIIQWSRTVYVDDDTKAIVCSRELKDWSDYLTILTVAKAGICFT